MDRLGLAIMAWQRPEYLARCLASLAGNDLSAVDVHLWQEGIDCYLTGKCRSDPAGVAGNLAVFEVAPLPHKEVHRHEQHQGIARQRLALMPYMAGRYCYWICCDDDVIWGRNSLAAMRSLFEQFETDGRVGSISPGFRPLCEPCEVNRSWDLVVLDRGIRPVWAEGWWASKFERIWPHFTAYSELIADVPYQEIARQEVRDRVAEWAASVGSDILEVSSDTALVRAVQLAGMKRLRPVLNRAGNVGEMGLNCRPGTLAQLGFAKQPVYSARRLPKRWKERGED